MVFALAGAELPGAAVVVLEVTEETPVKLITDDQAAIERVREAMMRRRVKWGLSREALAARIGVSTERVYWMETKVRHLPPPSYMSIVCRELQMDPIDLVASYYGR